MAIGKHVGLALPGLSLDHVRIALGGRTIYANGRFELDPKLETELVAHLRWAELYASAPAKGGVFRPPIDFPPHESCVEMTIDLAAGSARATVLGADLTHEYVSENADYRS
jgi:glutamate N-acetyltransferase/amino-acid N-acetyltransferase